MNLEPGPRTCIWCEESKWYDTDDAKSQFNSDHVLLQRIGSFDPGLTLTQSVCKTCNRTFGQTVEWGFTSGGIEAYSRLKGQKHKRSISASTQFRCPDFTMQVVDDDPSWNGVSVIGVPDGQGGVKESVEPQVRFKQNNGTWLALTERELDALENLKTLELQLPVEILFPALSSDVVARLKKKLAAKGAQLAENDSTSETSTKRVIAYSHLTIQRQRAVVKMGISYLAKVCEEIPSQILFHPDLKAAKQFAHKNIDPKKGIVVPERELVAVDAESGKPISASSHIMHVAFYDHLGGSDLVFIISLNSRPFGRTTQAVYLACNFKGIVFDLNSTHYWDPDSRVCKTAKLVHAPSPIRF